jgi:hypothetical protein
MFPPQILSTQKRSFVRITPMPSHLLGIGLWPLEPAQTLPLTYTTLGNAALSYRPDHPAQCTLLNLSAGGMRMAVPKEQLPQLPAGLTIASQLLCLLMLRSHDNETPMPFWLACAVVSLAEKNSSEDASEVIIGMKFKSWALSEHGSHDITWFPIGRAGEVPPIAAWVLRHQFEQHKWQT